jgi:peptide/nickel transport system substrate-binding protein
MKSKKYPFFATAILLLALIVPTMPTLQQSKVKAQVSLPVPRDEACIIEIMPPPFTVWNESNPFIPSGTQWGSGWQQCVQEWDWYINYATGEIIYWRITGWEYSTDYKTFTMHIRKGVTWNDGFPYTSHDIAFTLNMLKANSSLSGAQDVIQWVSSVETPDDYTIVIHLTAPNPRFHHWFRMWGNIPYIAAEHIWKTQDPGSFKNWPPVDTGPYKLYGVYPDLNLFIWVRRDDYWGKILGVFPAPKYVVWRGYPSQDLDLADFERGDVDVTLPHVFNWASITTAMAAMPGNVTIAPYTDPCPLGISAINCGKYPTNITAFRWAISYLMDKTKLAKAYLLANGTITTDWDIPMPYSWAVFDKYKPMIQSVLAKIKAESGYTLEYNPDKAKAILDKLGFTLGSDGFRHYANGTKITLDLIAGEDPSQYIAYDLADQLKSVGIDVNTRIVPSTWGDLVSFGQYDIAVGTDCSPGWIMGDPVPTLDVYNSKWYVPIGTRSAGPGIQGANPRYINAKLDADLNQLLQIRTEDPAAQALLEDAFYQVMKDAVTLPAVEKTFVQTFSNIYWTGWPSADNMYIVPYDWWPEFFFVLSRIKSNSKTTVYLTADVPQFLGDNGQSYGPFTAGQSIYIPKVDAERLILQGSAYTMDVRSALESLQSQVTSLQSQVTALQGQTSMLTTMYAVAALEVIVIIVLLVMYMRKK